LQFTALGFKEHTPLPLTGSEEMKKACLFLNNDYANDYAARLFFRVRNASPSAAARRGGICSAAEHVIFFL
jgi:hypothetical protein